MIMGNTSYRLNFDQGKKNETQHHSQGRHYGGPPPPPIIQKLVKMANIWLKLDKVAGPTWQQLVKG